MKYRFKTTPVFRKALAALSAEQKRSARQAFAIFRGNPFDPRLHAHKIHSLPARHGRTIHSCAITS